MRRSLSLLALLATLLLVLCLLTRQIPTVESDQRNAAALGILLLEESDGLFVLAVIDSSIAAKANIEPGDILQYANDTPLTAATDLDHVLSAADTGQRLCLTLIRDEQVLTRFLSLP